MFEMPKPTTPLSYPSLLAQIIEVYDTVHSHSELVERLGVQRFLDITDEPLQRNLADMTPLPPNFDQRVYRFNPAPYATGVVDLVFETIENRLVNMRAQLFIEGIFAKRKAVRYMKAELVPGLSEHFGPPVSESSAMYQFHGNSLVAVLRCAVKPVYISTHVMAEQYA